jgi:hypothetical protein
MVSRSHQEHLGRKKAASQKEIPKEEVDAGKIPAIKLLRKNRKADKFLGEENKHGFCVRT